MHKFIIQFIKAFISFSAPKSELEKKEPSADEPSHTGPLVVEPSVVGPSVDTWLESLNLSQYSDVFNAFGFDHVNFIGQVG